MTNRETIIQQEHIHLLSEIKQEGHADAKRYAMRISRIKRLHKDVTLGELNTLLDATGSLAYDSIATLQDVMCGMTDLEQMRLLQETGLPMFAVALHQKRSLDVVIASLAVTMWSSEHIGRIHQHCGVDKALNLMEGGTVQ